MNLTLASASPRRIELLKLAGYKPLVLPSRVPESRLKGEGPSAMVKRLAHAKAYEVRACLVIAARDQKRATAPLSGWVLGADTTVAKGSQVLEKPRSARDAVRMLTLLSGKMHTVYTGVALLPLHEAQAVLLVEATKVYFRKLGAAEIKAYVATGEPLDKAGAYGIQGGAAAFVRRIEGDYANVVGLPLARVVEALQARA
jgi:septum formation protein